MLFVSLSNARYSSMKSGDIITVTGTPRDSGYFTSLARKTGRPDRRILSTIRLNV